MRGARLFPIFAACLLGSCSGPQQKSAAYSGNPRLGYDGSQVQEASSPNTNQMVAAGSSPQAEAQNNVAVAAAPPPRRVTLTGVYKDSAGDSIEFRADGRMIVNNSDICRYSIDGREITQDCGRGEILLRIKDDGNIDDDGDFFRKSSQ